MCIRDSLKDMDKAVDRIQRAISQKETIAVFGDYDVDGITSTVLLRDYLPVSYTHLDVYKRQPTSPPTAISTMTTTAGTKSAFPRTICPRTSSTTTTTNTATMTWMS